jgi:hypothetical protein
MVISYSILLRMRNVSDKSCMENQNTHFAFKIYEMWKNMLQPEATDIHSEYVKFTEFPHVNIGYVNVPRCYVYMYIASLIKYCTWTRMKILQDISQMVTMERYHPEKQ